MSKPKFKIGDIVIGQDQGNREVGPVVDINWNRSDGKRDGYYINRTENTSEDQGQCFYYPEEVRIATKLERALK